MIRSVDCSLLVHEKADHGEVAKLRSRYNGSIPVLEQSTTAVLMCTRKRINRARMQAAGRVTMCYLVRSIDIGLVVDQEPHHLQMAILGSYFQSRHSFLRMKKLFRNSMN